ncbi:MAG: molybdenum cofactor biosynthesis protein MoaE [Aeromonas sp.]
MQTRDVIKVQQADFDLGTEYARLAGDPASGAVACFVGSVREMAGVDLQGLYLEHYPAMTTRALTALVAEARERWALNRVTLIHRVGELGLSEQIVLVLVSCAHREAAFAACEFLMDQLKTRAPFWKQERTRNGAAWVAAKASDNAAAARWQAPDAAVKE